MQRETRPPRSVSGKQYALDLETACAVDGCTDKDCSHALDFNRNKITVAAVSDGASDEKVFRGSTNEIVEQLERFVDERPGVHFTAHLGKFDFKQLCSRSTKITDELLTDDSCLLAFSHQDKIPESWLEDYNSRRVEENKKRTGHKHRAAGLHSLKTTAPYYLGVDPFWEPEHGHDDDEYVLKDARYCKQLTDYFKQILPTKSLEFYYKHQLPWSKMLMQMEIDGIAFDTEKVTIMWQKAEEQMIESSNKIREQWAVHFTEYLRLQEYELDEKFLAKKALGKLSEKQLKRAEINLAKAKERIESLNLDSPKQLLWLLRDRLGLDTTNMHEETSTDKETLKRLSIKDAGVAELLTYRKAKKLCSTYFPEYLNYVYKGRIHSTFNVATARTGRLSCSDPNLQQVPGALHELFIADKGKLLITRDLSAIEPTVLAYYSEDPVLCDIIINGKDFHGTTAVAAFDLACDSTEVKKLFPQLRRVAKTIGLAVLYGAGKNQVHLVLQQEGFADMGLHEANKIVTRIREKYKGVWTFKQALDAELETGSVLYNLLGRPISIKNRDEVYMKGLNRLIQSSASDILLNAAHLIKERGIATPLLPVHDELVSSTDADKASEVEEQITDILHNTITLTTQYGRIPIRTEGKIATYWEK